MTEFKNEREFQRTLIREAKKRGWTLIHQETSSFGTKPGFPDLVLVHGGEMIDAIHREKKIKRWQPTDAPSHGILVFELKVGKRQLTPYQEDWLAAFRFAGVKAYAIRPEHWDTILDLLDGQDVTIGDAQLPLMEEEAA